MDKLQTLSIFIFILDQIDKPSGVRIMGPNTLAISLAFHHVVSPWIKTEFNLIFTAFRFGVLALGLIEFCLRLVNLSVFHLVDSVIKGWETLFN
jgi:hypothetical protein